MPVENKNIQGPYQRFFPELRQDLGINDGIVGINTDASQKPIVELAFPSRLRNPILRAAKNAGITTAGGLIFLDPRTSRFGQKTVEFIDTILRGIYLTSEVDLTPNTNKRVTYPQFTDEQKGMIADLYMQGSTLAVIAHQLNCSISRVWKALKDHGITLRPPGTPRGTKSTRTGEIVAHQQS